MKNLLSRAWHTLRVYFGLAPEDPTCLGDSCGTGSLWKPR